MVRHRITYEPDCMVEKEIEADHDDNNETLVAGPTLAYRSPGLPSTSAISTVSPSSTSPTGRVRLYWRNSTSMSPLLANDSNHPRRRAGHAASG